MDTICKIGYVPCRTALPLGYTNTITLQLPIRSTYKHTDSNQIQVVTRTYDTTTTIHKYANSAYTLQSLGHQECTITAHTDNESLCNLALSGRYARFGTWNLPTSHQATAATRTSTKMRISLQLISTPLPLHAVQFFW